MPADLSRLSHEPEAYDPFQLVRVLEGTAKQSPRVGRSLRPSEDVVSFGQSTSMAFPPSSVAGIVQEGPRPTVRLHNFGLLGPNGPLPLHLTEYIHHRVRDRKDTTLRSFCDLLTNRLAALFYRAWAVNQPSVAHDRPEDDRYEFYLRCLLGMGTDGMRDRDAVPDSAKLYMAPRLRFLPPSAESLEQVLGDWFGLPCHVEQMVGQWIPIPSSGQTRLGDSPRTGSLGESTMVGERMWDVQGRFRVHLGPMPLAAYERLMPGRDGMEELRGWIRLQAGLEFDWDARLILEQAEVPDIVLGRSGMLGRTTWFGSGGRDRGDLTVGPAA